MTGSSTGGITYYTSFISNYTQFYLEGLFYKFGLLVYHRPCLFFAIGWFITLLCGLGFLNLSYENEGIYLWIPRTSTIFEEYVRTIDNFGEFDDSALHIIVEEDGNNLLTPSNMDAMFDILQQSLNNVTSTYKGTEYKFDDLCARPYEGFPGCAVVTMFDFWENNPATWQNQSDIQAVLDNSFESLSAFIGKVIYDETGTRPIGASFAQIPIFLEGQERGSRASTINSEWLWEWEDYWGDRFKDYRQSNNFVIRYYNDKSVGPEIDRLVSADLPVMFAAFMVMVSYLAVTLGSFSCVGARPALAIGSMLTIIFALIMGLGLGSGFGLTMNTIVLLIPFILLGVGVDDALIISESLKKAALPNEDPEKQDLRFGNAMKQSGLSISLTSIASVIAFSIGSAVDIPGINSFCLFAALAFLSNYILQLLIFVPILTFDERRMWEKRNFLCPCYIHEDHEATKSMKLTRQISKSRVESPRITKAEIAQRTNRRTTVVLAEMADFAETPEKEKSKEEKRKEQWRDFREMFSVDYVLINGLAPLHNKLWFRISNYVIFLTMAIVSMAVFPTISTESDPNKLLPDDSFVIDAFDALADGFGDFVFAEFDLIVENRDFSEIETRQDVRNMINAFNDGVDTNKGLVSGNVSHWLDEFNDWIMDETNGTMDINDLNQQDFYEYLKIFTNITEYKQWQESIVYNKKENPTKIEMCRFSINGAYILELQKRWLLVEDLEDEYDDSIGDSKSGFVMNVNFLYAYLPSVIVPLTLENLAFAGLGVYVALILLMDIRLASIVLVMIVLIDIDLLGWMVLNDIDLDTVSYSQVVMAVGLTVDYVIHVSHAIAHAKPDGVNDHGVDTGMKESYNYEERLRVAFHEMGAGVFKGAFTTFLGILTLIFSQSEAFRVFFLMFCGIILIAVLHGFLLIPSILADVTCIYEDKCCWDKEDKPSTDRKGSHKVDNSTSIGATELGIKG